MKAALRPAERRQGEGIYFPATGGPPTAFIARPTSKRIQRAQRPKRIAKGSGVNAPPRAQRWDEPPRGSPWASVSVQRTAPPPTQAVEKSGRPKRPQNSEAPPQSKFFILLFCGATQMKLKARGGKAAQDLGGVWVYEWRAHAPHKRPMGMGRSRIWRGGRGASAADAPRRGFPQQACNFAPATANAENRPEGAPQ